jgi:hypothetical protein
VFIIHSSVPYCRLSFHLANFAVSTVRHLGGLVQHENLQVDDEIISGAVATIAQVDPALTKEEHWEAVREDTTRQAPRSEVDGW